MKIVVGDNFGDVEKYKLYRNVYEILHPTISKKNISNYKVVFDEKLLPVLVFYPEKISNVESIIIYVPGDGKVNGCYGKYSSICKKIAKETKSIVITIDYFNSTIKYPTVVNKISKLIKYLYDELNSNGYSSEKITLLSDSLGSKITSSVVTKLISKGISINKLVLLYPVVKDSYDNYSWNESLMSINFNLDKRVENYLKKYLSKVEVSCNLDEIVYYKDFPKTLVVTGDMDIFKEDGEALGEIVSKNIPGSLCENIKFASHGFLGSNDEEVNRDVYLIINKFIYDNIGE